MAKYWLKCSDIARFELFIRMNNWAIVNNHSQLTKLIACGLIQQLGQ